jgi:glycosyltransferase involved in cell wall biosynthesis
MGKKIKSRPELIAFSENVIGGIQTFYFNLLSSIHAGDFEVKWFLLDHSFENRAKSLGFPIKNYKILYSNSIGRWRRAKQINRFVSNKEGLILANREYELDSLALFPPKNKTIFHIVHDDYYFQFAIKYSEIIDVYISHNTFIFEELCKLLPERVNDIYFIPYGIRLSPFQRQNNYTRKLQLAFIARFDTSKGIHELCKIDDILKDNNVLVDWVIIGDGPQKEAFLKDIKDRNNFKHLIAVDDLDIFKNIQNCDVFILPSELDGTPVSLLESMSVGLVPIIYEFNKGIKNVVTEKIGYVVEIGNFSGIAEIIINLNTNRPLLEERSLCALDSVRRNYNRDDRSQEYFTLFKEYSLHRKIKKYVPPLPNSILENPLIPQLFVNFYALMIRLLKKFRMNIIINF